MNQKVFIVCLDKSIALDIAKKIVIKVYIVWNYYR